MSAIASNLSQPSSFIYDDRYFGHALTQPTLRCWEKMTEPFPSIISGDRLASCVVRAFMFLALIFSSILFVPGLICKSIDYMINGPVASVSTGVNNSLNPLRHNASTEDRPIVSNDSTQQPAPILAPTTSNPQLSLASLARGDLSLEAEVEKLNSLQLFANEPILSNYSSLLPAARYLIAGRYTYPITFGWSFSTRFQLMETFEQDFRSGINLPSLNQAAREAVVLQEKMLFAKILLKTLERRESIEALAIVKPQIFSEINECLRRGYGVDFGSDILRTRPNDRRTSQIIRSVIHLWDAARYDISHFEFAGARSQR